MTATLLKAVDDFFASATSSKDIKLSALRGSHIVLYFYPKDSTPGCVMEGQDFSAHYEDFKKEKTVIFGISRDSLISHEKFKAAQSFPFELISDKDGQLCRQFDVLKTKNSLGQQKIDVNRSTFLINKEGILMKEWRGVSIAGHIKEVLDAAKKLNQ